ncbi:MAG: ABC transporter substrate-binding protein [Hyphomicrobiaceae bacterium]
MKRYSLCRTFAVLVAAIFSASAWAQEKVKDINVALIIPQSGPVMINVTPAVNSIKMALEEVNAKGIMINGEKYRFNVRWYNEECNPNVAINAARAALDQVKPLHVVWTAMCSQTAVAIRPLLLEAKVVAINPTSGTSRFVGPQGDPYLFKTKEEFEWRTRDLVAYLKKKGYKKGVIIAVNSDWGAESAKIMQKYAAQSGIELRTLNYDEHTEEFVPMLLQARDFQADFIFQASQLLDEQVAFLRSYQRLGLKIQLVGESTWTEDVPTKAGWDTIDGMLTAAAWFPNNPRPEVQAYLKKYVERFKAVPGFNGPPAYDLVYLTAQAFEKAGSLDTEALRKTLRTNSFGKMVYGDGTIKFDESGQAQFPVIVTAFDAKGKTRILAPGLK